MLGSCSISGVSSVCWFHHLGCSRKRSLKGGCFGGTPPALCCSPQATEDSREVVVEAEKEASQRVSDVGLSGSQPGVAVPLSMGFLLPSSSEDRDPPTCDQVAAFESLPRHVFEMCDSGVALEPEVELQCRLQFRFLQSMAQRRY